MRLDNAQQPPATPPKRLGLLFCTGGLDPGRDLLCDRLLEDHSLLLFCQETAYVEPLSMQILSTSRLPDAKRNICHVNTLQILAWFAAVCVYQTILIAVIH